MMKKVRTVFLAISLLFFSIHCGGGGSGEQNGSPVTIVGNFATGSAGLKDAAVSFTHIRFHVSGPRMKSLSRIVQIKDNIVEIKLLVPNGPLRHFVIEALDKDKKVRYWGEAYRDLTGKPVTIFITLSEKVLDISGTWVLSVTPEGKPERSDCFFIQQQGNAVNFSWSPQQRILLAASGTINGSDVELSGEGFHLRERVNFSVSGFTDGNSITGTYSYAGHLVSENGTWRADRGVCKKTRVEIRQGFSEDAGKGYWLQFYAFDMIPDACNLSSGSVTQVTTGSSTPLLSHEQESLLSDPVLFGENKPGTGDTYVYSIDYTDGTSETHAATPWEFIFDGPPVPVSPAEGEQIQTATPFFSWTPPPCNCQGYYSLRVEESNGNLMWLKYPVPKDSTSITYNADGQASPLQTGMTYRWRISAHDELWEISESRSMTFSVGVLP